MTWKEAPESGIQLDVVGWEELVLAIIALVELVLAGRESFCVQTLDG